MFKKATTHCPHPSHHGGAFSSYLSSLSCEGYCIIHAFLPRVSHLLTRCNTYRDKAVTHCLKSLNYRSLFTKTSQFAKHFHSGFTLLLILEFIFFSIFIHRFIKKHFYPSFIHFYCRNIFITKSTQ